MEIAIGVIVLVILLIMFSKSAAREANRMSLEIDYRVDSLDVLLKALNCDNDKEACGLERRATVLRARAKEIESKQAPIWKAYSKAVRKYKK